MHVSRVDAPYVGSTHMYDFKPNFCAYISRPPLVCTDAELKMLLLALLPPVAVGQLRSILVSESHSRRLLVSYRLHSTH